MYSTQKIGAFAVVEARNVPCPMEWGCPKDRSMTVGAEAALAVRVLIIR